MSPDRHQAIIWTIAGILLIGSLGIKCLWNFNRNSSIFIQENVLENVVCEMASILVRPQCVKLSSLWTNFVHHFINVEHLYRLPMAKLRNIATKINVNIGSGDGLWPDGTKPLLEPMLTNH